LKLHGYSKWSTANTNTLPIAVAYPRSTVEVSTIAKICHKYRVPIIPCSRLSSLEGNFSAPYERDKVERCVKNIVARALEMEGTCTGEHGVGIVKKEALLIEVG
jgi:FAD/FMN-containing dehydrogenase